MYKRLKKQNGEKFAQTLRNFHNGILEIPDIDAILRHAGREAKPLLPYLMSILSSNDDTPAPTSHDPFVLLDQAGYKAFHADTLEKQNSIKRYFKKGELLCTFGDSARYKNYHMIHAIKKDVEKIKREDFNKKEKREDAYGTSVISIQMLKNGGFISIKNRYNHAVSGCDNTFGSNPDNIIQGLSTALKEHFNVTFSATKTPLPEKFVLIGKQNQVFKYHQERNNIYYGDQAWAENGRIHTVNKSAGDALFDDFLFDNKNKVLKKIDPESKDNFADDFNQCYGGNRALSVQNGNLLLNGEILIGAEKSRIKTLHLLELTTMGNDSLCNTDALTHFEAPALTKMGEHCLCNAEALTHFKAPELTTMLDSCLCYASALMIFEVPALITMDDGCLRSAEALMHFEAPALTKMGEHCLCNADALTHFEAPALTEMGRYGLRNAYALRHFKTPALTTMNGVCLRNAPVLTYFEAPALTKMGDECLYNAPVLTHFKVSALTTMGYDCLFYTSALAHFEAPALTSVPNYLKHFVPHQSGVGPCQTKHTF